MRCPTLSELPPPPEGKTGWPWTVESRQLPDTMPDGSPWPRISIVTPSYNQGQFIEETIRSVLLQGYPDLEYIIIDGGSTDESVEIIKKYSPWLKYWVSEPDKGQAHAINKGFECATGSVGAYLNSDDYYDIDVFGYIASTYIDFRWNLLIGRQAKKDRGIIKYISRSYWNKILSPLPAPFVPGTARYQISQESTMWDLNTYRGMKFDESLQFCLDVEWYVRIAPGSRILLTSREIGYFRDHADSKSNTIWSVCREEHKSIVDKYKDMESDSMDILKIERKARLRAILNIPKYISGFPVEFLYVCPPGKSKPVG